MSRPLDVMNTIEIEKHVLALPEVEREQLATLAWESLVADSSAAGNRDIDTGGIEIAAQRDAEIEFNQVQTISHAEFLRRTGGGSE